MKLRESARGRAAALLAGTVTGLLSLLLALPPALAQEIPPGAGSADRPRPEYDPVGLRSGAVFFYPTVTAAAAWSDNIRAQAAGDSDIILTARPGLDVKSDWGRHELKANVYLEQRVYAEEGDENATDYGGSAAVRLDLGSRSALQLTGAAAQLNEDRAELDSPTASAEPVKFSQIEGRAALAHSFNRLRLDAAVAYSRRNFDDGRTLAGAIIDQDFRDVSAVQGELGARYQFSPGYRAIVRASLNKRSYSLGPEDAAFNPAVDLDRDSDGYRISAGVNFELTRLLYGTVTAGYLKQNYKSPLVGDVSGMLFGADLLWNVTTLTAVRLSADRRVDDDVQVNNAGRLISVAGVGVDHELLRNLIISLDVEHAWLDFNDINRSDRQLSGSLGVKYLLNRKLTADFGYRYDKRSSDTNINEFKRNSVGLGLTLTL